MPNWIRQLASLKLTVVLLVFIVLILAAGTVVEARLGTQTARAIYYAPWFLALQILFGVNVLCSLADRWPWGRQRLGFVLTHGALLVILLGALTTALSKQEGQLALWEGEESSEFVDSSTPGRIARHALPFSVALEAFEIDYYPGTRRPAQFRSRVRVTDPTSGRPFQAVIEMNRGLSHGGYHFFQSSYRQESGREMTILSVSRDNGQPIVFAGYALLLIGMITVVSTRISQRRQAEAAGLASAPQPAARPTSPFKVVGAVLWAAAMTAGATAALTAAAPAVPDPATVEALRPLAVQHDGRVMPLDTLAREASWRVTGKWAWRGIDPVALILGWRFEPETWSREAMIRIDSARLATAAGLPTDSRRVSFAEVAANRQLVAWMREARERSRLEEPLDPILAGAARLEERLLWLQRVLSGETLRVVPSAEPDGTWSIPRGVESAAELVAMREELVSRPPLGYPAAGGLRREVRYNRSRPTRIAWLVLAAATALALAAHLRPRRATIHLSTSTLIVGFVVMTWGLALRWQIAGRIPASNMFESMLFLGWGVGLFAVVASVVLRNRLVAVNAAAMATLTMLLLDFLPMDPFIHPMPPVLTGTPWLAIHVPITMVSYSVFAIGVLIAHVQIAVEMFAPDRRELTARMNDLLYWYIQIGSILLAAGILTGSIWAASSWGRYWGWDPKEVWSLIALLAYMAILHGRFDRLLGSFGTAALSILAFWTILMTYLGVNFVLSAGLHSYGFGESAVTSWLVLLAAIELLFLISATVVTQRRAQPLAT